MVRLPDDARPDGEALPAALADAPLPVDTAEDNAAAKADAAAAAGEAAAPAPVRTGSLADFIAPERRHELLRRLGPAAVAETRQMQSALIERLTAAARGGRAEALPALFGDYDALLAARPDLNDAAKEAARRQAQALARRHALFGRFERETGDDVAAGRAFLQRFADGEDAAAGAGRPAAEALDSEERAEAARALARRLGDTARRAAGGRALVLRQQAAEQAEAIFGRGLDRDASLRLAGTLANPRLRAATTAELARRFAGQAAAAERRQAAAHDAAWDALEGGGGLLDIPEDAWAALDAAEHGRLATAAAGGAAALAGRGDAAARAELERRLGADPDGFARLELAVWRGRLNPRDHARFARLQKLDPASPEAAYERIVQGAFAQALKAAGHDPWSAAAEPARRAYADRLAAFVHVNGRPATVEEAGKIAEGVAGRVGSAKPASAAAEVAERTDKTDGGSESVDNGEGGEGLAGGSGDDVLSDESDTVVAGTDEGDAPDDEALLSLEIGGEKDPGVVPIPFIYNLMLLEKAGVAFSNSALQGIGRAYRSGGDEGVFQWLTRTGHLDEQGVEALRQKLAEDRLLAPGLSAEEREKIVREEETTWRDLRSKFPDTFRFVKSIYAEAGDLPAWGLSLGAGLAKVVGAEHAPRLMDHFLDKSGTAVKIDGERLHRYELVQKAENQNWEVMQDILKGHTPPAGDYRSLFGKEKKKWPTVYDAKDNEVDRMKVADLIRSLPADGSARDIEFAIRDNVQPVGDSKGLSLIEGGDAGLAFGNAEIRSRFNGSVRRTGDEIEVKGEIIHTLDDPYDFKAPDFLPTQALKAWLAGHAREFHISAEWREKVSGEMTIKDGEVISSSIRRSGGAGPGVGKMLDLNGADNEASTLSP